MGVFPILQYSNHTPRAKARGNSITKVEQNMDENIAGTVAWISGPVIRADNISKLSMMEQVEVGEQRDGRLCVVVDVTGRRHAQILTEQNGGPPLLLVEQDQVEPVCPDPAPERGQRESRVAVGRCAPRPGDPFVVPAGVFLRVRLPPAGVDKDLVLGG